MYAKTLKIFGWVIGFSLLALGVGRMIFPVETIPGSGPMNATMDTETRAGGALLIGLGYLYIWAVQQPRIPVHLVRVLALVMAGLFVSRLISVAAVGLPHPIFIVGAAVEFIAAALTFAYSMLGSDDD